MFRLNNRGWGVSALFAFVCIFLIAIVLIGINAYKIGLSDPPISNVPQVPSHTNGSGNNGGSGPTTSPGADYVTLEVTVSRAGEEYKNQYYNQLLPGDSTYVTVQRLIDAGYLALLKTQEGSTCTGYVQLYNRDGSFEYHPFIKCSSGYQTSGYLERFDQ